MNSRSIRVARGSSRADGRQLVLGGLTDLVGDTESPTGEREVHLPSCPLVAGWALTRLTWSLPPHPPAEGFAAPKGGLAPSPGPVARPGAGLTSKPRHARPTNGRLTWVVSPAAGVDYRGTIPGQPQTRLRARSSIDTPPISERARRREQRHLAHAGAHERLGARRGGGSGRQDVVDDVTRRGIRGGDRRSGSNAPSHRDTTLIAGTPGLRRGRDRASASAERRAGAACSRRRRRAPVPGRSRARRAAAVRAAPR